MQIDRNALISQVTESCLQDGSCDRAGLQGNPAAPKKNPQHLKMHRLPVPGGLPSFTDSTPRWERRGPGLRSGPLGWGRLGAHAVRAQQAAAAKHPLICWATDLGTGASGDTACWRCSFHRHTLTPARLKESKIKGRWKQEKTRRVPPLSSRSSRCHLQGRDPQPRLQGLWPTQAPGGADSGWSLPSPAGPERPVPRSLRGSGEDKTGPAGPQRGNESGGNGANHLPGRNWTTGRLLHSGARGFEERKPEASASHVQMCLKTSTF